ncbi:hypothetical protein GYMLUDRAFT_263021 [Collybiopsis luxurians FD-317 M1]|uniref:Uncharacterized protein n=1 Tax=Collybiopsis luxurians FD-317 M1 TaxID=944289 RepID=A0A0D0BQT9_9AGAR|nr:hypothetical protein GYMLUDRAFT_263021 [Collybiopsis luxurians FD-317 M1]
MSEACLCEVTETLAICAGLETSHDVLLQWSALSMLTVQDQCQACKNFLIAGEQMRETTIASRFNPEHGVGVVIRVHMAEVLRAPILGDLQHTGLTRSQTFTPIVSIPPDRLFLHASEISFHRFRRTGKSKRVNLTVCAPLPV